MAKKATGAATGKGKGAGAAKARGMSLLDAAAAVLKQKQGKGITTTEMVALATEKKLWTPMAGKTPASTLYSSILREIETKGKASRFEKTERGKFGYKMNRVEPKDDGETVGSKGKPVKPATPKPAPGSKPKPAPKPATPTTKPKPKGKGAKAPQPAPAPAPEPEPIPQSDEFEQENVA